ncbi:MAG: hypothetical protein AABY22_17815 [Nanoarchaeota archaeon]
MKKILFMLGILSILLIAGCQQKKGNICNSLPERLEIISDQPIQFNMKFAETQIGVETNFETFTTPKITSPPCSAGAGCKVILEYQGKHIEPTLECIQSQTINLI